MCCVAQLSAPNSVDVGMNVKGDRLSMFGLSLVSASTSVGKHKEVIVL